MTASLFLRRLFLVDAATCLGCCMLLAGGALPLAPLLGLDAGFLRGAGLLLLPCVALFLWLGTRQRPPLAISIVAILGNILWTVESLMLIGMEQASLTPFGIAFVAAQALAVLCLALLESWGVARMRAEVTA